MQNQAAVEALYSATFVEDYLDTVENLPNELQQHLSSFRELDLVLYRDFLSNLDESLEAFEKETSAQGQRQILQRFQKGLILAQDIGDEKLILAQAMTDTIENRSRILEQDSKNLEFGEEQEDQKHQPKSYSNSRNAPNNNISASVASSNTKSGGSGSSAKKSKNTSSDDKPEKQVKRRRKRNQDRQQNRNRDDDDDEESNQSSSTTTATTKASGSKARGSVNAGASARKSVASSSSSGANATASSTIKRKSGGNNKKMTAKNDDDSDNDVDSNLLDIDPDEPTYCLCDQVSYGEMIGCDNDLCPIEWFHFQCVNLTNKPKGKWYCPKCRGDKPTVMKPKAQFLKELEKFNKEKEDKMMKQNS